MQYGPYKYQPSTKLQHLDLTNFSKYCNPCALTSERVPQEKKNKKKGMLLTYGSQKL
jgi:hypothetical protein